MGQGQKQGAGSRHGAWSELHLPAPSSQLDCSKCQRGPLGLLSSFSFLPAGMQSLFWDKATEPQNFRLPDRLAF